MNKRLLKVAQTDDGGGKLLPLLTKGTAGGASGAVGKTQTVLPKEEKNTATHIKAPSVQGAGSVVIPEIDAPIWLQEALPTVPDDDSSTAIVTNKPIASADVGNTYAKTDAGENVSNDNVFKPESSAKAENKTNAGSNTNLSAGVASGVALGGATGNASTYSGEDDGYAAPTYTAPTYTEHDDYVAPVYTKSQAVTDAENLLNAQLEKAPGAYQSSFDDRLNELMEKILGREEFSYDLNGDMLYQQYKDMYTRQGRIAMQDAMGQAAGMTGGFGNSYAASVGNQAYQSSMQELNDVIPELYALARQRYADDGQRLLEQYGLVSDREAQEYGRYRDSVADYEREKDYLTGRYDTERNFDYGKFVDDRNFDYGKFVDDRNFDYGKFVDDRNFDYTQDRGAVADEQWAAEMALASLPESTNVTDAGEVQDWYDLALNAETEEELEAIVSQLERIDPDLADKLYEIWTRQHRD